MTPAMLMLLIDEETPPSTPAFDETEGTVADLFAFSTMRLPGG